MTRLAPLAMVLPLSACLVGGLEGQYMNDLGHCTARDPAPDAARPAMLGPGGLVTDTADCRFDRVVPFSVPGTQTVTAACSPMQGGGETRRSFDLNVTADGTVTLTDAATGQPVSGGTFRQCPAGARTWF